MTWSHVRGRRADRRQGVAPRRLASERGETLIEIMFTVIMLGTGFVVVLSAIFTATNISDRNAQRTKASISAQALAESLLQPAIDPPASPGGTYFPQQSYTYVACAQPATYGSNGNSQLGEVDLRNFGLPTHYVATIEKIRYFTGNYNGSGPVFSNAAWDQATATNDCYATKYTSKVVKDISGNDQIMYVDKGMQELTIRIDSGARKDRVIDTLVVVKRDQRCPGTYDNADLGPC